tara:strand:+ start:392 stop:523 length:132 start_codon:yes stop_codon:yes gene_type:complete
MIRPAFLRNSTTLKISIGIDFGSNASSSSIAIAAAPDLIASSI